MIERLILASTPRAVPRFEQTLLVVTADLNRIFNFAKSLMNLLSLIDGISGIRCVLFFQAAAFMHVMRLRPRPLRRAGSALPAHSAQVRSLRKWLDAAGHSTPLLYICMDLITRSSLVLVI